MPWSARRGYKRCVRVGEGASQELAANARVIEVGAPGCQTYNDVP